MAERPQLRLEHRVKDVLIRAHERAVYRCARADRAAPHARWGSRRKREPCAAVREARPVIATPRLVLRPFTADDAGRLLVMSHEPGIGRWMPDQVYRDLAHALEVTLALIAGSEVRAPRRRPCVFGVECEGELIGHVGLSAFRELRDRGSTAGPRLCDRGGRCDDRVGPARDRAARGARRRRSRQRGVDPPPRAHGLCARHRGTHAVRVPARERNSAVNRRELLLALGVTACGGIGGSVPHRLRSARPARPSMSSCRNDQRPHSGTPGYWCVSTLPLTS